MKSTTKSTVRATLAMLGTIIGAGLFAIPLAFAQTGIPLGSVLFWLLAFVVLAMHLMYGEVILRRDEKHRHRFPGQVREMLGAGAGRLALLTYALSILGGNLAYLILGGQFLSSLSRTFGLPHDLLGWQVLFWAGGAVVVYAGLKLVARVEAGMTWMLIALMLVSTAFFLSRADGALFFQSGGWQMTAAVGVFLFALTGLPVISEVVELCGRDRKRSLLAIGVGSIGAALLMWLFGVAATAALGPALGPDPSQLAFGLPSAFAWLIPAVGFFAVATSFITLTQDLTAMIRLDLKLSVGSAWLVALGVPLVFLLFVTRDFLATVSFVGAIFGAVNGLLVSAMSLKLGTRITLPLATAVVFLAVIVWRILVV